MTTFETITLEADGRTALLTINRPQVRNAVNAQVQADIRAALEQVRTDDSIGALIFTGAGDKAFVAGADISQLQNATVNDALSSSLQRLYDEVETFTKPTIAAINGFALGGGCELAMACDIRIASTAARFGLPETTLGILPGAGGTQRLSRLVGRGRATEMILTGRFIDAEEALRIGLVTDVTAPDALLQAARDKADQILAKGPVAVRLAKLAVQVGADVDQRTGLAIERLAQAVLFTTQDKREGTAAFLEKRPAEFTGE